MISGRYTIGNEDVLPIASSIANRLQAHHENVSSDEVFEDILGFMRLYLDSKCAGEEDYVKVYVEGVLKASDRFAEAYFG